ncbi:ATP synthase subunit delta, mitochondrial-like [Lingula anatina]|uniref:ATP synthase F(1) complex subunit delta, mitochondrial n=1 Tax=Lingula anatina TaxID=7574 RepID=A0A1S3IHN5_LINAN|nr:ATP synthase subunit delta, mitochondrial-like [Lingula anatina]|eukprot:XP_013396999.1 ATP synthase subunit delta, mitochondrial-like [Lingula anatina]
MAMLRPVSRLNSVVSKAARLSSASLQQRREKGDLILTFASPGDVYYVQQSVKQVDVPTLAGSVGILPDHVPWIGCLKPGLLSVFEESGTKVQYFVSSGTATVNPDSSLQILAEEAVPVDRLDTSAVTSGLAKAQQMVTSAPTDKEKAEAQIEVECYEALQKALLDKH